MSGRRAAVLALKFAHVAQKNVSTCPVAVPARVCLQLIPPSAADRRFCCCDGCNTSTTVRVSRGRRGRSGGASPGVHALIVACGVAWTSIPAAPRCCRAQPAWASAVGLRLGLLKAFSTSSKVPAAGISSAARLAATRLALGATARGALRPAATGHSYSSGGQTAGKAAYGFARAFASAGAGASACIRCLLPASHARARRGLMASPMHTDCPTDRCPAGSTRARAHPVLLCRRQQLV
jgi:hypothetical protein